MMKFYVHFDGPPAFTLVYKWGSGKKGNVKLLLDVFLAAFNERCRPLTKLSLDNISLVDRKKALLPFEKDVVSVIKDGLDLFVVLKEFSKAKERRKNVVETLVQTTASSIHLLSVKEKGEKQSRIVKTTVGSEKDLNTGGSVTNACLTLLDLKKLGSLRNAACICTQALQDETNNSSALSCLAEIYLEAGRAKLALEYIKAAIEVKPNDTGLSFILGSCLAEVGRFKEARDAYLKYMDHLETIGASQGQKHDIQAAIADTFAKEGKIEMAGKLFSDVLRENDTHVASLKGFATCTAAMSEKDSHEAITIMITALVLSKGERNIRREVAKLISWPGGMDVFRNQMRETWESSESMMFMADILRESGAIRQALELVEHASQLSPCDPGICLYLVHTYEILNEYNKAFQVACSFIKRNDALKIANISFSQIAPFLLQVDEGIYLNNAAVKELPECSGQDYVGAVLESEFQQLGLLFTLVKILFVKGALNLVKPLLPVLDKLHSGRDLHLTLLRNEAAFYSCISHLMNVPFTCMPLPMKQEFIYFASDSHCLSPAWRVINYRDQPHVIHPLLATGVKIWHIRKEGCFYPKFSLLNALKEVPNGSYIIFNIGEIDCREGLLRAVHNCKYDTIEEAISATVEIYIGFLQEQTEQCSFVTFVHPIFPVLDETRAVVLKFNQKLEEHVKKCSGLHWLNLLNELLVKEHSEFNSEYKLDGTHVHPKYVSLLERALKEAFN